MLVAASPPSSAWQLPPEVLSTVWQWLQILMYVVLAGATAAVITLGAMLAIDKNRGEPVSATHPAVQGLRIALGVMVISAAVPLAQWFT